MSIIEEAKKLLECHIPPTHEYHKLEIYIEYKLLENLITELEVANKLIDAYGSLYRNNSMPRNNELSHKLNKALIEYEELK